MNIPDRKYIFVPETWFKANQHKFDYLEETMKNGIVHYKAITPKGNTYYFIISPKFMDE